MWSLRIRQTSPRSLNKWVPSIASLSSSGSLSTRSQPSSPVARSLSSRWVDNDGFSVTRRGPVSLTADGLADSSWRCQQQRSMVTARQRRVAAKRAKEAAAAGGGDNDKEDENGSDFVYVGDRGREEARIDKERNPVPQMPETRTVTATAEEEPPQPPSKEPDTPPSNETDTLASPNKAAKQITQLSTRGSTTTVDWDKFMEEQKQAEGIYVPGSEKEIFDPSIHMPHAPANWDDYEPATSLWEEIYAHVGVHGRPITVAHYMRQCLQHPVHGYYIVGKSAVKDDFDKEEWDDDFDDKGSDSLIGSDFFTSPEVSQMFGEILGCWFTMTMQLTQQQLLEKPWQYVEAGPGKGSLLVDLMRFWSMLVRSSGGSENFAPKAVHLLETSPKMREVQRQEIEKLNQLFHLKFFEPTARNPDEVSGEATKQPIEDDNTTATKPSISIYWHDSIENLLFWQKQTDSYMPSFIVCQEFMDALPVHSFEKTAEGWRERMVDITLRDEIQKEELEEMGVKDVHIESGKNKLRLRLVTAPDDTPAAKRLLQNGLIPSEIESGAEAPIGSVVEMNPDAVVTTRDIGRIIGEQGGGALIIDYGQEGSYDSIRAFSDHKLVNFLSQPGRVDVTADVDFAALRHAVNVDESCKATAHGPVPQGQFLAANGIQERAQNLYQYVAKTEDEKMRVHEAYLRLCSPEEMGEKFKVLAITPSDASEPPPGFAGIPNSEESN